MAFTCPRCGIFSANPNDEREGYCGECHDVTGEEEPRYGLLPHLTVFELRQQLSAVEGARKAQEFFLAAAASDEARAALAERVAALRSLYTANAEAIINARAQLPADTLRLVAELRRHLATMEFRSPRGTHTAAEVHGTALDAIESTVVDHLRARIAQMEMALPVTRVLDGSEPAKTVTVAERQLFGPAPSE